MLGGGATLAEVSARIARRVWEDFGTSADHITDSLKRLSIVGRVDHERLIAAMPIGARRDRHALDQAVALAKVDWRDVLMYTGMEQQGWERQLDEQVGPAADCRPAPPGATAITTTVRRTANTGSSH